MILDVEAFTGRYRVNHGGNPRMRHRFSAVKRPSSALLLVLSVLKCARVLAVLRVSNFLVARIPSFEDHILSAGQNPESIGRAP